EEFLEQVWTERLREFPLEMKIWTDVQRTRKYPVAASGGQGEVAFRNVVGATSPSGSVFQESHLLMAVSK
ncbi:MAG: RagB/SusD family nutrient uptake outer membrane protein, partial [Rikenellaceae bacterium]|nr:RagB/SusD family nutrient uptake outer membrane protein [Rikenellaceae bacterium]